MDGEVISMQEIRESHIYHNGIPDWIDFWDSDTNKTTRYAPERTCRMSVIETRNKAAYEHYEYIMYCERCYNEFGFVQYNECGDTWQDDKPTFCPFCGARVVHEQDLGLLEGDEQ